VHRSPGDGGVLKIMPNKKIKKKKKTPPPKVRLNWPRGSGINEG